ncbi:MAG: hypothetical protein LBK75_08590 [Oscillospiraceae bacterium]|nr:hypothetical protein [Oscillospiraceae bacterium]
MIVLMIATHLIAVTVGFALCALLTTAGRADNALERIGKAASEREEDDQRDRGKSDTVQHRHGASDKT